MARSRIGARWLAALGLLAVAASCGEEEPRAARHLVFFEGYLWNGVDGRRLPAAAITSVKLRYRDQTIETTIEPDGRFVAKGGLPLWQDYTVEIAAPGFRRFVSHNPGLDLPASLRMTDEVVSRATTQTLRVDARLFPEALMAPGLVLTVAQEDDFVSVPPPPPAAGVVRFRPRGPSLLERTLAVQGATAQRQWFNDEDLFNRTLTKMFTGGRVEVQTGELVYGVSYEVTIYGVPKYQPLVLDGGEAITAGVVMSRSVTLLREVREPLRVLSTTAELCMLPPGNSRMPVAGLAIRFNEPFEFAGEGWAELIDNGLSVGPAGFVAGVYYCPLKTSMSATAQERGTVVVVQGNVLTLAFDPSAGLDTAAMFGGAPCVVPPTFTSVQYQISAGILVQPVGDSLRRRSLLQLLQEHAQRTSTLFAGALRCGSGS